MANNTISFRGEVNEMSAAFFCREMETLAPRSAATVYLHTPGGDVYAGGEMVNAMRAALKRGCRISLEVGSLCASMGAALLAAARASGCRAACHANSEVMFHGCWSVIVGGADELTDQAKAMRDFNAVVQADLRKCGVADTDEWFAADRQKWINADELLALGLVDEIIEAASADPQDLKGDAVKIAALLNHKQEKPEMDDPKIEAETPVEAAPAEPAAVESAETAEKQPANAPEAPEADNAAPAEADAPEAVQEPSAEARAEALANKRFAGLQAKHDRMICDLTKERDAALKDLEAAKAVATSLQADVEKLEHDLAEARDQLAKGEQIRGAVVADALAPDDVKTSWASRWRSAKRSY